MTTVLSLPFERFVFLCIDMSSTDKVQETAIAQAKAAMLVKPAQPKEKGKAKKASKLKAEPAPELDWDRIQPADERDGRLKGPPCYADHDVVSRANQHAAWTFCQRCGVTMSYVPRQGKSALRRSAGPLIQNVKQVVEETAKTEELGYNPRQRHVDRSSSCGGERMQQLERIRQQRQKCCLARRRR